MTPLIILAAWLCCPVLCYGMDLAYFQREYPMIAKESASSDRVEAVVSGLFGLTLGPLALVVAFFMFKKAKHGLKFK